MKINERKSTLSIHYMEEDEIQLYRDFFPYELREIDIGIKYLGFQLNPNFYRKEDWH
jgi:hypothetical protein